MKHIVFDLGAVLLTWQPRELIRRHLPVAMQGRDIDALARELFHHDDWLAFDRGDRDLDETARAMSTRTGIPLDALLAMIHVDGVDERLLPILETVHVLKRLRARRDAGEPVRLYYLSNMPAPYARALERSHDFFSCFDGGVFSGDVRLLKPQPEIYQILARRHGLQGDRTLFIDDHLPNVQAARALGWQAHHHEDPSLLQGRIEEWLSAPW